ncbi:hypothetical protein IP92_00622 [Pseudoduganella flava]|uniref:Uncharacterized protein n=1 Tax=Pseudoduganella flava TaxID=871742 RepID=A0A562Q4G0_9BURK|nr:hypothetical protein [Pseudoduganella flava]QGZ41644.1 hypothetical protein GO485_23035 [Pseudoduganella flava]TWI51635.1 hypothetical protein IP92_00622 [Pseudoduganella flava]
MAAKAVGTPIVALLFGACLTALSALGAVSGTAAAAVPTHFGDVMGNGLLCRDQTTNRYYYDYMVRWFGQPYKREGGAWWFRTPQAKLWGFDVVEVIVSDETFPHRFVGAVTNTTPEKLAAAITQRDGLRYAKITGSAFPVREAPTGTRIVYADRRSKIYCGKFKPLPPALR